MSIDYVLNITPAMVVSKYRLWEEEVRDSPDFKFWRGEFTGHKLISSLNGARAALQRIIKKDVSLEDTVIGEAIQLGGAVFASCSLMNHLIFDSPLPGGEARVLSAPTEDGTRTFIDKSLPTAAESDKEKPGTKTDHVGNMRLLLDTRFNLGGAYPSLNQLAQVYCESVYAFVSKFPIRNVPGLGQGEISTLVEANHKISLGIATNNRLFNPSGFSEFKADIIGYASDVAPVLRKRGVALTYDVENFYPLNDLINPVFDVFVMNALNHGGFDGLSLEKLGKIYIRGKIIEQQPSGNALYFFAVSNNGNDIPEEINPYELGASTTKLGSDVHGRGVPGAEQLLKLIGGCLRHIKNPRSPTGVVWYGAVPVRWDEDKSLYVQRFKPGDEIKVDYSLDTLDMHAQRI